MRKSVISSSVTTIVAQVNDCLVVAGVALRTLLTRTWCKREHCRGWHEPRVAFGMGNLLSSHRLMPGLKRSQQRAFAYCPAYAAAAARFAPRG